MIRVLIMIAVAGFLVATVALSAAVAIGGPEALARGAWTFGPHAWDDDWDWDHGWSGRWSRHGDRDEGPRATREVTWTGGDKVELNVPAVMTFTQAPGPARLTISGPAAMVERVEVEGGQIRLRDRRGHSRRVTIAMTAPDVTRFDLGGRGRLTINDYDHDSLTVELSGGAKVIGRGRAKVLDLNLSGASEADFRDLAAEGAQARVSGDAEATLAPRDWARLDVSGSGDVRLKSRPARLETDISGAGKVRQQDGSPASPPAADASR